MKLYADITDRKAHYSDRQFRSLVEVYALSLRMKGCLPSRRALAAKEGQNEIEFLFAEGDLEETEAGVRVHNWAAYQSDPTNAARQARYRNSHPPVTVTNPPSSSSSNGREKNDLERTLGVQEKADTRPLLDKVKEKDPTFRVPTFTPAPKPSSRKRP